jgi:hypothetical protein
MSLLYWMFIFLSITFQPLILLAVSLILPKKKFYKTTSSVKALLVFFFSSPFRNNYVQEHNKTHPYTK